MLNAPNISKVSVPSANEEEYCHFCFSSANLNHLVPLEQFIRPDVLNFIDTFVGVQLSFENDVNFTLCRRCIDAIEFCITFRDCSRKHHEALRETRNFNRAVKHLQSVLQESLLEVTTQISQNSELPRSTLVNDASNGSDDVRDESAPFNSEETATVTMERSKNKFGTQKSLETNRGNPSRKRTKLNEQHFPSTCKNIRRLKRRDNANYRPDTNGKASFGLSELANTDFPNGMHTLHISENNMTSPLIGTPQIGKACFVVVEKLNIDV